MATDKLEIRFIVTYEAFWLYPTLCLLYWLAGDNKRRIERADAIAKWLVRYGIKLEQVA